MMLHVPTVHVVKESNMQAKDVENLARNLLEDTFKNQDLKQFTFLVSLKSRIDEHYCICTVSYTHLDVYKRQVDECVVKWFKQARDKKIPVSGPLVRAKACLLYTSTNTI